MNEKLSNDETFKKYSSLLFRAKKFPVNSHIKEVIELHKARKSRSLLDNVKTKNLVEAVTQDQAYRSRMVHIRLETIRVHNMLQFAINATTNMIMTEYRELSRGNTKEERRMQAQSYVREGSLQLERLASLLEITQEAISDIDSAGWACKHALDGLAIATKGEFQV